MIELKANAAKTGIFGGCIFAVIGGLSTIDFSGSIVRAILFTIIPGVLFGFGVSHFLMYQYRKNKNIPQEILNEGVIAHGPANHFLGLEGRGGWLYLTRTNLIFKSHGLNLQNSLLKIPISQIMNCKGYNNLGIIPNGIQIQLTNNILEKFVVSKRNSWIQFINASHSLERQPMSRLL